MLEGFKAGGVRRGEYRTAMGLPALGPADDDVFVLSPMMIEVPAGMLAGSTGTGSASTDTEHSEEGGAQVTDEDRKVLHLPLKKKAL